MNQLLMAQPQKPLGPQECTIIVLQPQDDYPHPHQEKHGDHDHDENDKQCEESHHIRIQFTFDPNSTCQEFKEKLLKHLSTSKYKQELHHEPSYYSELGITNDDVSPHDIFEVNICLKL